jgi:aspartate racemase
MEGSFYRHKLEETGLEVLLPSEEHRLWINQLIFNDLCAGVFEEESRRKMATITDRLREEGAEAVVLGCTELPLILSSEDSPLPLLDTMALHVSAAVDAALGRTCPGPEA